MPLVGTVCCQTGKACSFDHCLRESRSGGCDHGHPLIATMANSAKGREGSGLSTTTIIRCPRQVVIEATADIFERPEDYYARYRGTAFHALEERAGPFDGVVQESRLFGSVGVLGEPCTVSGSPDWFDEGSGILRDTKSTARIPSEPYQHHIEQVNIYRWLIHKNSGRVNRAQLDYSDMRSHKLMDVPLWPLDVTEAFIVKCLEPLVRSKQTGTLPPVLEDFPSAWECRYCSVKDICVDNHHQGK